MVNADAPSVGKEGTIICDRGYIVKNGCHCLRKQDVICADRGSDLAPVWTLQYGFQPFQDHCRPGCAEDADCKKNEICDDKTCQCQELACPATLTSGLLDEIDGLRVGDKAMLRCPGKPGLNLTSLICSKTGDDQLNWVTHDGFPAPDCSLLPMPLPGWKASVFSVCHHQCLS